MKVAFFSTHAFERPYYVDCKLHELCFFDVALTLETAKLAKGFPAICCFTTDSLNFSVLDQLAHQGVRLIALRSAGFNHVDLHAAMRLNITVVRVPRYSPYAVAEHAAALILALNRKINHAYLRIRENNFSIDGLKGFDLHGKTVGVIGTGNIGTAFAQIMRGFGCNLLAHDPIENETCLQNGVRYVSLNELYQTSDIISLHCPLNESNYYLINERAVSQMKQGMMLINTSRGGVIDTAAVISGLKSGKIAYLGIDVYEAEEGLFFKDHSEDILMDDTFARLQAFPHVLITGHQAFLTHEALLNIANITINNMTAFETGTALINVVIP